MLQLPLPESCSTALLQKQLVESFYHSHEWHKLITELYDYELIPLTTTDKKGLISGYLPLCFIQSPLTGQRLVSLPFSDFCPLLAADAVSINNLIDQAINEAKVRKVKYLELRTGLNETLAGREDLVEENQLYVHWLVSLSADPDKVWSCLRKSVQQKVNKSKKLCVQVRIAQNRQDIEHYYRLHLQTRSKKHGMPAQPREFFYGLWDAFAASNSMRLLLAEHQGKVIASAILLAAGPTLRYAYSASDERYLNLAPNNLLIWTALKLGCENGYQTLDLGRTSRTNEGLMGFKRRWGAIEEPLPYYYYPRAAGLASTAEDSWKFRVLTSFWKRLPLSLTGAFGGYLYKHMG